GGRGSTEGRRQRRFRAGLVVGEVALALVLTTGAALMVRSFAHLRAGDLGFDPSDVMTARLILPDPSADASGRTDYGYGPPEKKRALYDHVLARLRELPGVEAAGATTFLPLSGWSGVRAFEVEGRPAPSPADRPQAQIEMVDEGYFRAMRMPIARGRGIDARDVASSPRVVVVNQALARRIFGDEDPIGHRIDMRLRQQGPGAVAPDWREVVGVVGDVAVVAAFLAALGLYGVMAHAVARRTHEIGIRMAVGARAADVLSMVVRDGLGLAAAGAGLGLVASLALTRVLGSLLYGVSATDPVSLGAVAAILPVVAARAPHIPGRRAGG